MRTKLAALAAIATALIALAAVARAESAKPTVRVLPNVRVLGRFLMAGEVKVSVGVPGERPGEQVKRTWRIRPYGCSESDCPRLVMVRNRGGQRESKLTLSRTGTSSYRGTGTFAVPLRCLGHTYARGSLAPYVITLRVLDYKQVGPLRYATAILASYVNASRTDRTRCPLGVVHDAASYIGVLKSSLPRAPMPPPPPVTTTTATTPTPVPTATVPVPVPTPTVPVATTTGPVPGTSTPAP